MDNDPTIPSQLGPVNTMPAALGAIDGSSRAPEPGVVSPALKFGLVVAAMALLAYLVG